MLCIVIIDLISLMILDIVFHSANAVFHNESSGRAHHGSCRLRSVREAGEKRSRGSMTQSFILDDIEYKLCRYHVTWDEALVFCSTHEAHLATLDDDEKTLFVAQVIASSNSASEDYWIGARKYYDNVWTWDSNAKKLDSKTFVVKDDIPILYPDTEIDEVRCLTIDRAGHSNPIFIPRTCNQQRGFICQRESDRTFDGKIRMIASSRIGDEEFRLYSGRATWAEAVVQCRQEGLEIAEVETVEQARTLARSMLRNRPVGIESAWIGGYTRKNDPSTWRWLASGEKIKKNVMWRKNFTESSDGCLLLDRHLCEIPIYVNTKCDRRRDVLCQKQPKKRFRKKSIEAIVDGCRYWIGFHPSRWSEARRSCERVNASLVVLDSPKTISHIMKLMLDNRADESAIVEDQKLLLELRHVWTDGRREKKTGQWQWQVNSEIIPTFGSSLIPWCSEEDYNHSNEFDCLNLDRENVDSPLVYGLSCSEKQSYVCQPRTGECVFHSVSSSTQETNDNAISETVMLFEKNLQNFQHSGVTGTMPIVNDNNEIISTTKDSARYIMGTQRERLSLKNSTSDGNLSDYLSPLSRLTLPSFPQFGIKVASALETTINPAIDYDSKRNKKIKHFFTTSSSATTRSSFSSSPTSTNTLKKMTIGIRKSQITRKKIDQLLATRVLETTTAISRKSKPLKIHDETFDARNSTKNQKTFNPPSTIFGRKTTRESNGDSTETKSTTTEKIRITNNPSSGENLMQIFSPFAENIRTEKPSIGENLPSYTLRRITASSQKKRKKLGFTTEFPTPYDAIDEDYYDNYETEVTAQYNEETNGKFNDGYDEGYDEEPENVDVKKKTKPTSSPTVMTKRPTFKSSRKKNNNNNSNNNKMKKINVNEKKKPISIPIIQDLSKNLQNALVNMLKKGIEKKNYASKEKTVKSTTRSLREKMTMFSDNLSVEKLSRMKSNTENYSLRPYYAFEGPMVVELSDDSNLPKNADGVDGNGKIHDFKFIAKENAGLSLKNKKIAPSRFQENRRRNNEKTSRDKNMMNDMSIVVAGLPPIRPSDPNSMMKMGYYIKDKFADVISSEENSDGSDPHKSSNNFYDGRKKKLKWPQRRYRAKDETPSNYDENRDYARENKDDEFRNNQEGYENSNVNLKSDEYYQEDLDGKIYPRDDEEISVTQLPLGQSSTREKSWQERLKISWPDEDNFTSLNVLRFDESVSDRNFVVPVRTTRSFKQDPSISNIGRSNGASLGDFKISKLIKEFKVDIDQRSLRKYLETFAKKIIKEDVYYKKDDWKDTWRYVLRQMSKIFDRMNVNINGDVMKIRIASDESKDFDEIDKARKIEWMKKLRKQKKDFTNFVKNISKKIVPKINETKVDKNNSGFIENPDVTSNIFVKEKPAESTTGYSKITSGSETPSSETWGKKSDHRFSGYERYFSNPENKPDAAMILEKPSKPETETPSRYDETIVMDLRRTFLQPQRSIPSPTISDKMLFRETNDEEKLENVYGTKYENFNNSHILAAPALVKPVGMPKVYNFQPIMQQLHHRLAFNQGLAQFRPDRRTNNITEKTKIFRDENLRKIVSGEYNDQRYHDDNYFRQRPGIIVSTFDDETLEDKDNEREKSYKVEDQLKNEDSSYRVDDNETISESDDQEFDYDDVDESSDSFDKDYSAETVWSPTIRLRNSIESLSRQIRLSRKSIATRSTKDEENFRKFNVLRRNNRRSDNDRGRDEIVKNLEYLTKEPSIVSLRIIIHSDEKDTTTMKRRESADSLGNFGVNRTVELRLKFSGSQKIFDENDYTGSMNDAAGAKINNSSFDGTTRRRISSRIGEKMRKRAMLQKLRDMSRKISAKNYTLSWRKENGSTIINMRDRKSRNSGIIDNMKNSDEAKDYTKLRQYSTRYGHKNSTNVKNIGDKKLKIDWNDQIASLFTNLKENDDELTLYINLTLGEFETKLEQGEAPET